jgi:CO/xanthine dehydrogenase Mo-binding subunit
VNTQVKTQFNVVGTRPVRPDGADKVTGRALYGADLNLPGMLHTAFVRSPHAHAVIESIDFSEALAMPGVMATMTAEDLPEPGDKLMQGAEIEMKLSDMSPVILARGKVMYHAQPVAALAATSASLAAEAAKRVKVSYKVLPHVLDMHAALADDAPVLHDHVFTQGVDPVPETPSNLSVDMKLEMGDVEQGLAEADVVLERTYRVPMCHQGYIEPHAAVASADENGRVEIWCCTQGPFVVRNFTSQLTGIEPGKIKVTASEIGGGFGGKTTVYLEPVVAILALKAGRPVKAVMSREEVFRATGPVSNAETRVRIGVKKDGTLTAIDTDILMDSGAFSSSSIMPSTMFAAACYRCANMRSRGREVLTNKARVWAYRAPGAPQSILAVECAVNEIAQQLGMDPIELRLKNAVEEGDVPLFGLPFGVIGLKEALEAARDHPHYSAPLAEGQGRGVAAGFWINAGMQSSATINVSAEGAVNVLTGNPDIGGSRASMALMAAEVLGVPVDNVHPAVADTDTVGYCDGTGGSRTTLATGGAVIQAAEALVEDMRGRAAALWNVDVDTVTWRDGCAIHRDGESDAQSMSLVELAASSGATGGPLCAVASLHAHNSAPSFAVNVCDAQVDPETGKVDILRFTCVQDAGKAIHPAYVEGQMQGGAVQGIGWALNEEYLYNDDGVLDNAGFLDYRIPVASDLPMIDTVILEIPNPLHPYGVRGVGELPICPPMPAVATAVNRAAGTQLYDLPLSPPKVFAAIEGLSQ